MSPSPHTRKLLVAAAMLLASAACVDTFEERALPVRFDVGTYDGSPTIDTTGRPDTWTPPDTVVPDTVVPPDTSIDTWKPDADVPPDTLTWSCYTDQECGVPWSRCNQEAAVCVECLTDTDCGGGRPICDPVTFTCSTTWCEVDWQCNTPFEVCTSLLGPYGSGTCVPSCVTFQGMSGGCADGRWCTPSMTEPGIGMCVPSQAGAPTGAACVPGASPLAQGSCADHNLCLPTYTGGECTSYCDPNAFPGAPGDRCSGTEACIQVPMDDLGSVGMTAFGICLPTCGYHEGIGCLGNLSCVPSEVSTLEADLCIEMEALGLMADCSLYGLGEGELCGPTSVCVDMYDPDLPGVRCHELCIATPQHPLGSHNHPDCSRPQQACEPVFAIAELGLCL